MIFMGKNKFNLSVAMTMILYAITTITIMVFNIRVYSLIAKSDDVSLTRFYGIKALMVTVVILTVIFLAETK